MKGFVLRERALNEKGTFLLNESMAAEEELFVLKGESLEKGNLPLNESKAADEALFTLKRERALKKEPFRRTS